MCVSPHLVGYVECEVFCFGNIATCVYVCVSQDTGVWTDWVAGGQYSITLRCTTTLFDEQHCEHSVTVPLDKEEALQARREDMEQVW